MSQTKVIKEKHPPLEGKVFNGITFLEYLFSDEQGHNFWKCRCPYDNKVFTVREDSVKGGGTTSCGCVQKEKASKANKKYNTIYVSLKFDYAKVYYNNYDDFFMIDKKDIPLVEQYCWTADVQKRVDGSIVRIDPVATIDGKIIRLSRLLLAKELALHPEQMQVDHINGNPQDNRRCNLRIASALQNNQNKKSTKQAEIIYKNGKYVIINFPKEDTSMLFFDTYAEAEEYLEYLWKKYNYEKEYFYNYSQELASQNESFVEHGLTWGSSPYNKIQELPVNNPLRSVLDEFSSVYVSGEVIPDELDREFDNIALKYKKEQASE